MLILYYGANKYKLITGKKALFIFKEKLLKRYFILDQTKIVVNRTRQRLETTARVPLRKMCIKNATPPKWNFLEYIRNFVKYQSFLG